MSDQLNAIVTRRTEVASGLIILEVAPDGWDLPEWNSGQFAVLGLPASAPRTRLSDPEPPTSLRGRSVFWGTKILPVSVCIRQIRQSK